MQAHPKPRRTSVPKHLGVFLSRSGSYEVAYRDSDGKLRFKTTGKNLQEAIATREELRGRVRRGERVAPSRVTLTEFSEEWLDGLAKRPRTLEAHRYHLRRHLLPRFGRCKLTDIQVDDVARMVAKMQRDGYSGWTISGALSTLSACLRVAERRGLINSNPARRLDKSERPKFGGKEKRILTEEEIGSLLKAAGTSGALRTLVAVGIFSGLRFGEVLGLCWADVDFDGGFIRVRKQLGRDRRLADVKSDSGRRAVVLMPQLARLLRERRMASPYKAETDFVFPAPGGQGRDHRSTGRAVERAVRRAGLGEGVSFHGFRHGFASMLIVELRLDPVNVARQLGHADPAITLRTYSHEFARARDADTTRQELAARFGGLLASS